MARYKKGHKKRRGFGVMSYVKPVAFSTVAGTAGGLITPKIPKLNTIPYANAGVGAVFGVVGGYLGKKSWKGAAVGAVCGAISGAVIAPPVGRAINQFSGMSLY